MNSIELLKDFKNKLLQLIAFFIFPSSLRVILQKLKGVSIGHKVFIGSNVYIDDHSPHHIHIGEGSFITAGCIILAHQRDLSSYVVGKWVGDCPIRSYNVNIGRGVHIGMGSIILPGVSIGDGAIIGAGSVVNRDIPAYSIAVGVPAKVIRNYLDGNEANLD